MNFEDHMSVPQLIAWNLWVRSRPESVKALIKKYPPRTRFQCHARVLYVVSYGEFADGTAGVQVSETDPAQDYDKALRTKEQVCSCCTGKLDALLIP